MLEIAIKSWRGTTKGAPAIDADAGSAPGQRDTQLISYQVLKSLALSNPGNERSRTSQMQCRKIHLWSCRGRSTKRSYRDRIQHTHAKNEIGCPQKRYLFHILPLNGRTVLSLALICIPSFNPLSRHYTHIDEDGSVFLVADILKSRDGGQPRQKKLPCIFCKTTQQQHSKTARFIQIREGHKLIPPP